MKLYIVGPVASGKSTLARQLSQLTGTPCFHLDEIVHAKDPTNPQGNRKRSVQERDELFHAILAKDSYIMEDTGRSCFLEGIEQADSVLLLDVSPLSCGGNEW
jgi:adenylate kinase family enzyme